MKRRIFGSLGAIALTGALALSAGAASADSTISLEEEYNFSSATKMTYTLRMSDSSGTVVTKESCAIRWCKHSFQASEFQHYLRNFPRRSF